MKFLTLIVLSGLVMLNLSGCFSVEEDTGDEMNEPVVSVPIDDRNEPDVGIPEAIIEGEDYFDGFLDASIHDWYVSHLKAMEEGPLDQSEPVGRIKFRFLWLRSFDKPYVVRGFQAEDGKLKLHMKSAGGAGGYEPGKKEDDVFVHLTATQATQILRQLDDLRICEEADKKPGGFDGAQWVFEVFDQGKYCLVDVWSPDENSNYYAFGVNLLKTTRVKTWEIDVY